MKADQKPEKAWPPFVKILRRWLPLALLLGLMAYAYAQGWHKSLTFEQLQVQKENFQAYVLDHPVLSILIFTGVYAGSVALSLPFATLLTLLGGFLFGRWLGTFLVVIAATIGATLIFWIARTSLGAGLRERAGGLYQKVADNMEENAVGYLLFLRLVPIFPFFAINILPALFNISTRIFVLTTFFGIIPGSFVYVNLGETLSDINAPKDLLSTETLLAFALLGLFALIPTIYKQIRGKK